MSIHGAPQPHPSPSSHHAPWAGGWDYDSPLTLRYPQPVTVQRELSSTTYSRTGRQMGHTYLLYLSPHWSLRRPMSLARPTQDQTTKNSAWLGSRCLQ